MTPSAAITGMGAVSGLGAGCTAYWAALEAGRTCIRPIRRFPTRGYRTTLGAQVDDRFLEDEGAGQGIDLAYTMAVAACREAWSEAGLGEQSADPRRIALVLGSGMGDDGGGLFQLTERVADCLGIDGPRLTVSTACCSSTNALGLGRDLLAAGAADVVLAGGVDVLTPEVFSGFHALGVLNSGPCAPFSTSTGTTLGEGAGFMILESPDQALARGCTVLATIEGYGLSGDGFHETSPDPKGAGVGRAMAGALADAGMLPESVGYVNAHGSGTVANDPAEWRGIRQALGGHARVIPVSSLKGTIGHAQGAAGVLEAMATVMALRRQVVVPTLNFVTPRPFGPDDPVGQAQPRPHAYRVAISNNSAFGGCNAAVVLAKDPGTRPARRPAPVLLVGVGAVGPFGLETADLSRGLAAGRLPCGRVPEFRLTDMVPAANPRGLDPSSRFLTAAAARALADAGVRVRGELRERAGLLVGAIHPSPASMRAFRDSIRSRGLERLDAKAFARIVLNAAGGECSKLLGLRGPNATVTTGPGSGFAAVVQAARLLASRTDTDLVVGCGVDELAADDSIPDRPSVRCEGAAGIVLARADAALRTREAVAVEGFAFGPPGRPDIAMTAALAMTGGDWSDLDAIYAADSALPGRPGSGPELRELGSVVGETPATGSTWILIEAVNALRRGEAKRILVVSNEGRSVSAALVIGRPAPTPENMLEH